MTFDVTGFLSGFKAPEVYKGVDHAYGTIAVHGDNKLAIHFEPVLADIPYKGKRSTVTGFGIRLVEIGTPSKFGAEFGTREKTSFKTNDGESVTGFRLIKEYIPLTLFPCSGSEYHKLALKNFPALTEWLKSKVEQAGGTMSLSDPELLAIMENSMENMPIEEIDLFHLPGVKPEWLKAPKKPGK